MGLMDQLSELHAINSEDETKLHIKVVELHQLEVSMAHLKTDLAATEARKDKAEARAVEAEDKHHEFQSKAHAQLEQAHHQHAQEMLEKVKEDSQLAKLTVNNENLDAQVASLKDHLAKALEGHELGDELKALHDRVTDLQKQGADLEAERTELMHKLEVVEKKSARLDEDAEDQRSALKTALEDLNSLKSDHATEKASAEQRAKRIEDLEGAHHEKTKEVLSHEAEAQKNRISDIEKSTMGQLEVMRAQSHQDIIEVRELPFETHYVCETSSAPIQPNPTQLN